MIKQLFRRWQDRRAASDPNYRDGRFDNLQSYCMFIGYPRSSHSLIGALLDAHPEVIIAHEQDALKHIKYKFDRTELFTLLLKNSEGFARNGRKWSGYSYEVPGQHQGRFTTLRVIGDKKGSNSARRLGAHPELLQRLRQTIDLPLRIIHVVRNPFDNITTIAYRDNGSSYEHINNKQLSDAIEKYFTRADIVARLKQRLSPEELFDLRIESFIASPAPVLNELCAFLGVAATAEYLDACAGIVYRKPSVTRERIHWNSDIITTIEQRCDQYPFLQGYRYGDTA